MRRDWCHDPLMSDMTHPRRQHDVWRRRDVVRDSFICDMIHSNETRLKSNVLIRMRHHLFLCDMTRDMSRVMSYMQTHTRDMTRAGAAMMSYMETRWRRSHVIHGDSHS